MEKITEQQKSNTLRAIENSFKEIKNKEGRRKLLDAIDIFMT